MYLGPSIQQQNPQHQPGKLPGTIMTATTAAGPISAELRVPGHFYIRVQPAIADFEPGFALEPDQAKPETHGALPANLKTKIPHDAGPVSARFDDEPERLICELRQPPH